MTLSLNLLHEEIAQEIQRKRDPFKIVMCVGGSIAALLLAYYVVNVWETLAVKSRFNAVERDWAKVEPKVTAAQKRAAELNNIVNTTKVLDGIIDTRFYWAPLLGKIAGCVAPNVQLTSLDGGAEEGKGVTVTLDGVAAGREPRSEAEEFRQLLLEQIGKMQKDVKVEFKTLEDLDSIVNVGGTNMPTAHFIVTIGFNPYPAAKPAAAPARGKKARNEEKAD